MTKKNKPLRADILTIFPEICEAYLGASILGRARTMKLLDARCHQLRDWATDRHHRVDDRAYGGGPGMVMKIEPFHKALMSLRVRTAEGRRTLIGKKTRVIVTSAKGKLFTQEDAHRLSKYDRLVFLCGRYEGIDERVTEHLADEDLSIGPYVLTGGELPALVMVDAIARLRPGVLGKEASLEQESWSRGMDREYPHYTRPEKYRGWCVPPELLSGHHANIEKWRQQLTDKD